METDNRRRHHRRITFDARQCGVILALVTFVVAIQLLGTPARTLGEWSGYPPPVYGYPPPKNPLPTASSWSVTATPKPEIGFPVYVEPTDEPLIFVGQHGPVATVAPSHPYVRGAKGVLHIWWD